MKTNAHECRGFTLVELMVAIGLVGVLISFAAPDMSEFLRNSRVNASADAMLRSFNLARAEAIKRQLPLATGGGVTPGVTVCASNSTNGLADTALDCNGGEFIDWFVFVDDNGDGAHDSAEAVIARHERVHDDVIARQDSNGRMTFNSAGFAYPFVGANTAPVRNIVFCDRHGIVNLTNDRTNARAVRLSATGRASVTRSLANVNATLAAIRGVCP